MVAVATFAVVSWGEVLRRRSAEFSILSASYKNLEKDYLRRVEVAEDGVKFSNKMIRENGNSLQWHEQLQWWSEQLRHSKILSGRYAVISTEFKIAANRPWYHVPYSRTTPSADRLLPPPDLPFKFSKDPNTHKRSPY